MPLSRREAASLGPRHPLTQELEHFAASLLREPLAVGTSPPNEEDSDFVEFFLAPPPYVLDLIKPETERPQWSVAHSQEKDTRFVAEEQSYVWAIRAQQVCSVLRSAPLLRCPGMCKPGVCLCLPTERRNLPKSRGDVEALASEFKRFAR